MNIVKFRLILILLKDKIIILHLILAKLVLKDATFGY